jgi:acetate kinase
LATQGGLLGLSGGLSGDIRDLESAASQGNGDAQLALDVYIAEIRRHLGGMLMLLGGADAIVFTGGIGENGRNVRQRVCENAIDLGIQLDADKNAQGKGEYRIDAPGSRVQLWVIPTNEELVVARQTMNVVKG